MPSGRPKGTTNSRRLVLDVFDKKHQNEVDKFYRRWPKLDPKNAQFLLETKKLDAPPSLSYGEIVAESGLSRATVSSRLSELVLEGSFSKRRRGKLQEYVPRSLEILYSLTTACEPPLRIGMPRGRPRLPAVEEETKLIQTFHDLSPLAAADIKPKWLLSSKEYKIGNRLAGMTLVYRGKLEAVIKKSHELERVIRQEQKKKRGWRRFTR